MNKLKEGSPIRLPASVVYLAFVMAGYGLNQLIGGPSLGLTETWQRGIALTLVLLGLALDGWAGGMLRRQKQEPRLVTSGPFALSRNPIYQAYMLIYAGFAVIMDSPLSLALILPLIYLVDQIIQREERELSARFGADYDHYRQKVRRWL